MKKKPAIRVLKRRPDGMMGVVLVDPATGLDVINPNDYEVIDNSQNTQAEFNADTQNDETTDTNESVDPLAETDDAEKVRGERNRISSVYDNDTVFDAPDTPISHAIDSGKNKSTSQPAPTSTSRSTQTSANTTTATSTKENSLGEVSRSTVNSRPSNTGTMAPGSKGTISNIDRTGLSAGIQGVADGLSARGYSDLGVNSGFRDAATNAKAGGAKQSQHLHGNAMDLNTKSLSDETKADVMDAALSSGAKGIGVYGSGALHVDTRENATAWGPSGYTGSMNEDGTINTSAFPDWAKDNLSALSNAGGYSYLSKHNVATPTARPTDNLEATNQPSFAQEKVQTATQEALTPASKAAMGLSKRTPEETKAMSFALAGELDQKSLEALSMGDETAISELSNMIGALENRAVAKNTTINDQLTGTMVNSMMPDNLSTTQQNFDKYGQTVQGIVDGFYSGAIPDSLSVPDVTHWANMDIASPAWSSYADVASKVGSHTFFGGLTTADGTAKEYGLPSYDNPKNAINESAETGWANEASKSISSSAPDFGGTSKSTSSIGSKGIDGGGQQSGSMKNGGSYSGNSNANSGVGANASGSVSLGGSDKGGISASGTSGGGLGASAGAKGSTGPKGTSSSSAGLGGSARGSVSLGGAAQDKTDKSDGVGGRSDGWV